MNKTKVINLIGGPGSGKSTTAAGLFSEMKMRGYNVELSLEFAKDLVYEGRNETFKDELYIFGKQAHSLFRLDGKVDYIITDRPLIMSQVYNEYYSKRTNSKKWNIDFNALVKDTWDRYDNTTIFLTRKKPFISTGRNENEIQAKELDKLFKKFLNKNNIPYITVDGDNNAVTKIIELLKL